MTFPASTRAALIVWISSVAFGIVAADSAPAVDPQKIAETFMASVASIQAETSIDRLQAGIFMLKDVARTLLRRLNDQKAEVESLREKIKAVDGTIETCELSLASGSGDTSQLEAQLKTLQAQRKDLGQKDGDAYKDYTRFRGQAIVQGIIFSLLVKESEKRLEELGNNTARGTWSSKYASDDGVSTQPAGTFSLFIDATSGAVTGSYLNGTDQIAVIGKWDPTTGTCSGTGNDPDTVVTWNGTLKKDAAGYTGSGSLAYKPKAGGSGSGSWTTK